MKDISSTAKPFTLFFRNQETEIDGDLESYVSTPTEFNVTFEEQSLGILIRKRKDVDQGAVVFGFKAQEDGSPGPAEACGKIAPGQILIAINGKSTLSMSFKKTIKTFVKAKRPITLTLRKHPDFDVTIKEKRADRIAKEPLAMHLDSLGGLVVLTGFEQLPGQAEQSGMVRNGMHIMSVSGQSVDGQTNIAQLIKQSPRPISVVLYDPEADDAVIVSYDKGHIGLLFSKNQDHIYVSGFQRTSGPVEREGSVFLGHVLTHVEGEPVGDSVETAKQLISDALAKNINSDKRKISLTFRDMDLYEELYPSSSRSSAPSASKEAPE